MRRQHDRPVARKCCQQGCVVPWVGAADELNVDGQQFWVSRAQLVERPRIVDPGYRWSNVDCLQRLLVDRDDRDVRLGWLGTAYGKARVDSLPLERAERPYLIGSDRQSCCSQRRDENQSLPQPEPLAPPRPPLRH